jgi:hypothetical protein
LARFAYLSIFGLPGWIGGGGPKIEDLRMDMRLMASLGGGFGWMIAVQDGVV